MIRFIGDRVRRCNGQRPVPHRLMAIAAIGVLTLLFALGSSAHSAVLAAGNQPPTDSDCTLVPLALCHADWMGDLAPEIGQRPLTQVVIPSAHDAGSYQFNRQSLLDSFAIAQVQPVADLLELGIRHFDVRVEPCSANALCALDNLSLGQSDYLTIAHGSLATGGHADDIFGDVQRFMLAHPKEVIILDINTSGISSDSALIQQECNEFLGAFFDPRTHQNLLLASSQVALDWSSAGASSPTTLNDIWNLGGPRIIGNWNGCSQADAGNPDVATYLSGWSSGSWSTGNNNSWYANQCMDGPYSNNDGIVPDAQSAIAGRFPGTASSLNSTPATGPYIVFMQATPNIGCIASTPLDLDGTSVNLPGGHTTSNEEFALDAVLSWYQNNLFNVRRNLNILSDDFAGGIPSSLTSHTLTPISLVNDALEMNGGPTITATATGSDGTPLVSGGSTAASQVTLSFTCSAYVAGDSSWAPATLRAFGPVSDQGQSGTGGNILVDQVTVPFQSGQVTEVAQCVDQSGRIAREPFVITFDPLIVTVQAPTPPAGQDGYFNNSDVPVSVAVTVTDTTSAITGVTCLVNGASTTLTIAGLGTNSVAALLELSTEGKLGIICTATDQAGSSGAAPGSRNRVDLAIDRTPPSTSASALSGSSIYQFGAWTNQAVTVTLTASDNLSGLATTYYALDDAACVAAAQPSPDCQVSHGGRVKVSTEGRHVLTFFSVDRAGNVEPLHSVQILIDTTPPVVTCSASPANIWPPNHKYDSVTTSVNVSDALSGANGFVLTAATASGSPSDIEGFTAGAASTTGKLKANKDEVYTLTYQAADNAGNTTTCVVTIVVQHGNSSNVPSVSAISPTNGPPAGGTIVEIEGTNFSTKHGGTTVNFGNSPARIVRVTRVAGKLRVDNRDNTATACANSSLCYAVSPGGTGSVPVTVTAKAGTSPTSGAPQFSYTATCGPTALTASPMGSAAIGTGVALTAVDGGCGSSGSGAQYQFWVLPPGGSWSIVQPYDTSATASWGTTGLIAGSYDLAVWVKAEGSTNAYDSWATLTYTLTSPAACNAATLAVTPSGGVASGTPLTLEATANGCGQPTYEFWVLPPGGSWRSLTGGYSTSGAYTWAPNNAPPGTYDFAVWAEQTGSSSAYETYAMADVVLTPEPCSGATLAAGPSGGQRAGQPVVLSATASGCNSPEYEFWVLAPTSGSTWISLTNGYQTSASETWTPPTGVSGSYLLAVWVRVQGSAAPYETYQVITNYPVN